MSKPTITEFLEARIAEDEAEALDAPKMSDWFDANRNAFTEKMRKKVLVECAAKRAILEQAEEASSNTEYVIQESCINQAEKDEARATDPGRLILHALAAVYASHPDYQQEWAL